MDENDVMRKYAEAHGFELGNEQYTATRPMPCVRDEHGEIKEQSAKALIAKIDEELNEMKCEIYGYLGYMGFDVADSCNELIDECDGAFDELQIAEEAADTITAITTLCEALGIDAEVRDAAQRRVNNKNRKRNRL